ncbi:MAG: hypothetical protein NZ923_10865, partial [Candidatus Kryptonium sp.]|nr:hypothetical protein [Candidatus Kryptonium sp.]
LTGAIQTKCLIEHYGVNCLVSIPHRCDSNSTSIVFQFTLKTSFNPSQVRFKHGNPSRRCGSQNKVSIPHRCDSNFSD